MCIQPPTARPNANKKALRCGLPATLTPSGWPLGCVSFWCVCISAIFGCGRKLCCCSHAECDSARRTYLNIDCVNPPLRSVRRPVPPPPHRLADTPSRLSIKSMRLRRQPITLRGPPIRRGGGDDHDALRGPPPALQPCCTGGCNLGHTLRFALCAPHIHTRLHYFFLSRACMFLRRIGGRHAASAGGPLHPRPTVPPPPRLGRSITQVHAGEQPPGCISLILGESKIASLTQHSHTCTTHIYKKSVNYLFSLKA